MDQILTPCLPFANLSLLLLLSSSLLLSLPLLLLLLCLIFIIIIIIINNINIVIILNHFAAGKWFSVPSAAQEVCIPWGGAHVRGAPVRLRLRGCTPPLSQESLPKGSHQAEEVALCPFRHQSCALPGDLQGRLLQPLLQLQNADKPYLGGVPCTGLPCYLQLTLLMSSAVLWCAVLWFAVLCFGLLCCAVL